MQGGLARFIVVVSYRCGNVSALPVNPFSSFFPASFFHIRSPSYVMERVSKAASMNVE